MSARSALLALFIAARSVCLLGHVIEVPGQEGDIQAAIEEAEEGDIVRVAPGDYVITEPISFLVQPATIASWLKRIDESGRSALVQTREPVNRPSPGRSSVARL
jgi:hypothetical protein